MAASSVSPAEAKKLKRQLAAAVESEKETKAAKQQAGKEAKAQQAEITRMQRQLTNQKRAFEVAADDASQRHTNAVVALALAEKKQGKQDDRIAQLQQAVKDADVQKSQLLALSGVQSLDALLTALLPAGELTELKKSIPTEVRAPPLLLS
jgi:hypothetical protein